MGRPAGYRLPAVARGGGHPGDRVLDRGRGLHDLVVVGPLELDVDALALSMRRDVAHQLFLCKGEPTRVDAAYLGFHLHRGGDDVGRDRAGGEAGRGGDAVRGCAATGALDIEYRLRGGDHCIRTVVHRPGSRMVRTAGEGGQQPLDPGDGGDHTDLSTRVLQQWALLDVQFDVGVRTVPAKPVRGHRLLR